MPIPCKQPYKSQSFIERTDINEFLRDDRVIGEIYNATIMSLSTLGATLQPLDLLNDAYYLCTLAINDHKSPQQILSANFKCRWLEEGRELVYSITWCLLTLQDELVQFPKEVLISLRSRCRRHSQFFETYYKIIRDYASNFKKVINFSGQMIEEEPQTDISTVDQLMQAQKLVVVTSEKLIRENQQLRERVNAMEENHRRELESIRSRVMLAEAENQQLRKQIEVKDDELAELQKKLRNPRTIIKEVPREIYVETPEGKVFNADNIAEYAKGVENDSDATVISTMMKDVCLRKQYFNKEVLETIDSIRTDREAAKEAKLRRQQGSTTFNIEKIGTFAPSAQTVNNTHHGAPVYDTDDKRYRGFASRYAGTVDEDFDGDEEFQKAAAFLRNYKAL